MLVRFVYHDRMELAGQSAAIMVDLSDQNKPIDNEMDILPGVTQVSETTE